MRRFTMRAASSILGVSLLLLLGAIASADQPGVNDEGFIQRWLVLAPIPFAENEGGVDALNREQVKDEAKLKPKASDRVKVGDKELVWKEHVCQDHLLDFNGLLGNTTEDSVAYAVAYVIAAADVKGVKMK